MRRITSWQAYDATIPVGESAEHERTSVKGSVPVLIGLGVFFVLLLLPMYFMVIGSLQHIQNLMAMPPRWLPLHPSLESYATLFRYLRAEWPLNTLIVTLSVVALTVLISCAAGYSFAFFKFPGKRLLWMVLLLGLMVPYISLILPKYAIIKDLHISGTLAAVILPLVFSPTYMYLARTYFETVPLSLLESARLEGAEETTVLTRIVMPVSKPIVSAIAVFSATSALSDFLWQMLVLQRPSRQTLLIGLVFTIARRGGGDLSANPVGKGLAMGCILLVPLMIVFIIGNRYFVNAIGGALKE